LVLEAWLEPVLDALLDRRELQRTLVPLLRGKLRMKAGNG
jgi:hypothetical protein